MNIVAVGGSEILYDSILALENAGHKVVLIITAREAPEYSKNREDFMFLAERIGAKCYCTREISPMMLQGWDIDIGVSFNYVSVIPQEIIDMFPYGILNAHGGDLPRYRGNACQAWAIINGEERMGLCIHKMQGGKLDSGDIVKKVYKEIDQDTRVGQLWYWMHQQVPELFIQSFNLLQDNRDYFEERQSEANAVRCYPRNPNDGWIDWTRRNIDVLRLINASTEPYQGAFCQYNGRRMTVWRARLENDSEQYCAESGQVTSIDQTDGSVMVVTGYGKIRLTDVQVGNTRAFPAMFIKSIRKRLM
jgi:UDP-4-amino-4-deoxy-L-arabinose formyltransferase/UDP-glucuronic acid dehydrogenase (UDP-4-keto-hexauronic acid decarboxylating)